MQKTEGNVIHILTLRLDAESQAYFDQLRELHFPKERNYLKAHLTLFHQLPNDPDVFDTLRNIKIVPFEMEVSEIRHLGAGVAYEIASHALQQLHAELSYYFAEYLIPQDQQRFKPHITVQNKVTPAASRALLAELREHFKPFMIRATGLDLWIYQGGPWEHQEGFEF